MKLRGLSVKAQTEQGHTITPLPSGARRRFKGKPLELLIDLCESLPKRNKNGEQQLHTKSYPGLRALILDRTGIDWHKGQLSSALKTLTNAGVVRKTAEGDLEIVYEAFDQPGLYSQRRSQASTEPTAEPSKSKPAKRTQPKPALTTSEAPAINATPLQVIEDIERQMEPQHVHADKKPMHHTPARQQFHEDPYDALPRSTGDSFAAWEARQRAEMNEFKRSTQEPESPAQEESVEPAATESVAVRIRRMADADPTFGMSFLERIRYEKEQDRIRAAEQKEQPEENPFISLFGLDDTDQDDQQDDGGSDTWGNDSSEVADNEMW